LRLFKFKGAKGRGIYVDVVVHSCTLRTTVTSHSRAYIGNDGITTAECHSSPSDGS
jgi:hypothetical protein